MPVAAQIGGGGSTRGRSPGGGLRNPGIQPQLWNLISAYSRRLNLDPYAVAAVSRVEGGGRFGAVGDSGTSFGPFQLHVGGALPPGRNAAWANSAAGVLYAMQHMAQAGAAGLRGIQAVNAIVRRFERPANPGAEVRSAFAGYRSFGAAIPGADTGNYQVQSPNWMHQMQQLAAQQTRVFQQSQASLLKNLTSQAAQARQANLSQALQLQSQQKTAAAQLAQRGVSGGGAAGTGVPAAGLYDQQKGLLDTIRLNALRRSGIYAV